MGVYVLEKEQLLAASLDEVWDFISSPKNLKTITPDYMGFDILSENPLAEMYEGMIIRYHVSPLLGLKMTWVTEITKIQNKRFFIDEQRIGPYKLWHHQHHIEQTKDGVLMKDIVHYAPPFGFLGSIANALMIKKKLAEIFDYRQTKIEEIFPKKGGS